MTLFVLQINTLHIRKVNANSRKNKKKLKEDSWQKRSKMYLYASSYNSHNATAMIHRSSDQTKIAFPNPWCVARYWPSNQIKHFPIHKFARSKRTSGHETNDICDRSFYMKFREREFFCFAYTILVISCSSLRVMSRLVKNSGTRPRIVKYMSSFLLHFSSENLHPRRKVIRRRSSANNV